MFCGNCGAVCPDGSSTCPNCGSQLPPTLPPAADPYSRPYDAPYSDANASGLKPDNYLIYSILSIVFTSLCCCIPVGIVPLIYSMQVDNKWKENDASGAVESAKSAKIWNWVCLGFILFSVFINIGTFIFFAILNASIKP